MPRSRPRRRDDMHPLLRQIMRACLAALQAEKSAGGAEAENLLVWARRLLPEHFDRPPSRMHLWLAEQLAVFDRRRGCRLNVIGPRGSAKSTVGTLAYVLRRALEGGEPYIWIVSDTRNQAAAHLENLRQELESNRQVQAAYPRAAGKGRPWRRHALGLPNGVTIEAIGTGERIRGRRRAAQRPTLIICDDLQNDSHIDSARQRESSRRWFDGTLLHAGSRRTNVLNLATALHREALAWQLASTPGWTSGTFQAIEQWPARMDLWEQWEALYREVERSDSRDRADAFYSEHQQEMLAGAELLWPESEPLLHLMKTRVEVGPTAFDREKQSSPVDPSRCEWPDSYFDDSIWFDDWPGSFRIKTMALDPSKGVDARRGDDSAYVMLGVATDGVLYVEADLVRRPVAEMLADGVALHERFRPQAFGIEANQFQDLLAPRFAAEFQAAGLIAPSPWLLHNRINKRVRIRRIGPYLSQRRMRFRSGSAGTKKLVEQLMQFPEAAHDDGPDALEMAIRLAEELSRGTPNDGLGDRLRLM